MKNKLNETLPESVNKIIAQAAEDIVLALEAEQVKIADSLGGATPVLWHALEKMEAHLHSLAMKRGVADFDAKIEKMEKYLREHGLVDARELAKKLNLSTKQFLLAFEAGFIQASQTPYDFAILTRKGPLALYYSANLSLSTEAKAQILALEKEAEQNGPEQTIS